MDALTGTIAKVWGFDRLRPLQEAAMRASLAGRDVLLVLPTGGGKSLTFQAPALLRDGLTLVVSPLISLMKDQVDGLVQNGVAAGMLNSAQDPEDRRRTLEALRDGALRLLYVAPERLFAEGFLELLRGSGLAAMVVDEAHCISHWGHDFRPEYRRMGELRQLFPGVPIHACTATATPRVQNDIAQQLGLVDPELLVGSFDRPNLTYRFLPRRDRLRQVMQVVKRHEGEAGIVYALRRADVDKLAAELQERGVRALPYHAGLSDEERAHHQEEFLGERCDVVVATVAFGMGIDRPDVRFVVHAAMPKSLEHYLQESGRAGRDGDPAECVLLYGGADYQTWRGLLERGENQDDLGPSLERLGKMYGVATGARCRHRTLVEWFGQELEPGSCDACDVCLGEIPTMADSTVVAQKILSCVWRLRESFGAGHVADVLRGADTEKIRRMGHHQLSTYGLLEGLDGGTLKGCIDQLVGQGLLRVSEGQYPTLALSEAARPVLRSETEVTLLEPPRPVTARAAKRPRRGAAVSESGPRLGDDIDADVQELFDSLRELRRVVAQRRRIRPYLVFSNRTLLQMAMERPATEEALLDIKGVGAKKAADLGPLFLACIRGEDVAAGSEGD